MSINFPSSLDTLVNPSSSAGDTLLSVPHDTQHANANDAIEALEAKVGVDSSAVTTSLDYLVKNTSSSDPGHKHTLANGATDVTASATELNYVDGVTSAIQTQLDAKVDENAAITGATKTKITYDAKGLVTAGADATTADIAASTDKNYVTDAQAVVIGNTSGTNTGDQSVFQTIATSSGTSPVADTTTDTLNLSGGTGITVTGDSATDTVTIATTITQYTDEMAQDAVGGMVDTTLTYTDGTPELKVSNPVTPQTTGFTITAGTTPKTLTVALDANVSGTNTGDQTLPVKATGAEVDTGTDDAKFLTAKAVNDSHNVPSVSPGTSGNVLTSNGTDWTSAAPAASGSVATDAIWDAKGDLAVATGANTAVKQTVGSNGQILIANSAVTNGIQWQDLMDSMYRQAIINGNFDVWQRGTSIAGGTGGVITVYSADRWQTYNGSATSTYSRQDGTGVTGSRYCMRVQRNSGQTATTSMYLDQALETENSIKFRGIKVTLSFWARAGSNYSPASSILVSRISTGKGTDQNLLAGFTTQADQDQNNTLTTSWQKFTMTTSSVIASDITQLAVNFFCTPVGTASTNDYFEVAQVQLCAGDVALPFQPQSYDEVLDKCLRYCWVPDESGVAVDIAQGQAYNSTGATILFVFPKRMRIAPSLTATASDWKLNDPSTGTYDVTSIAIDGGNTVKTRERANCAVTVASGLTTNRPYLFRSDAGGTRVMVFNAEL